MDKKILNPVKKNTVLTIDRGLIFNEEDSIWNGQ